MYLSLFRVRTFAQKNFSHSDVGAVECSTVSFDGLYIWMSVDVGVGMQVVAATVSVVDDGHVKTIRRRDILVSHHVRNEVFTSRVSRRCYINVIPVHICRLGCRNAENDWRALWKRRRPRITTITRCLFYLWLWSSSPPAIHSGMYLLNHVCTNK